MSEAVVLGGGQLYTADRGPIRLYEDIIQALLWKYPFYDTFINQWLKITIFFLFFRCGHNYTADQDLIRLHDYLIQVLSEWHLHQKMKSYWDLVADLDWKQDFRTCVAKFHFVLIYFCFLCIFNKVFRNLWKICLVPHYMFFAINTAVIF